MRALLTLIVLLIAAGAAFAQEVPQSKAQIDLSFAPVVKQAAPAVVNVYARRMVRNPFADDPFYRQFFGDPGDRQQQSLGSGVIVREDGTIVTNNHVIEGADELIVVLADRREFEAKLVLADPRTDLAILKIEAGAPLPALAWRDSDTVEVGDLVIAIGNPFGVGQTVTQGIVSAVARTNAGIADYQFFIQTDAAINPGNSGGALVTLDGKLVGINTAIFSRSGGSIGIGFAIPSNMVRVTVEGAKEGGVVARAWLGAETQEVTADIAQSLGLERPAGVLVQAVFPGGPADGAGIKSGDVILTVNGFEVNDPQSVRYRIATAGVGQSATLEGRSGGAAASWTVALTAPPDGERDVSEIEGRNPLAGLVVANLTPALADELQVQATGSGVVVMGVRQGKIAWRYGFQRGDILTTLNETPLDAVRTLKDALTKAERRWRLTITRNGQQLTLEVGG
jgi:serine protease Do